jgi:hypothetical protein
MMNAPATQLEQGGREKCTSAGGHTYPRFCPNCTPLS